MVRQALALDKLIQNSQEMGAYDEPEPCIKCGNPRLKGWTLCKHHLDDIQTQPEQEPVAYSGNGTAGVQNETKPTGFFFQMPPKREWVGLTKDDVQELYERCATYQEESAFLSGWYDFAAAIENKLRERNK
jgi:hypothetical protein